MKRGSTGDYITVSTAGGETCKAFLPKPLPPEPELQFDPALQELYDRALLALGKLSSLTTLLPDTDIFIYTYVRKEAVLSSQIEGTQSSLNDLLQYESMEAPGVPLDDLREVSNYVRAINYGIERLRQDFPLSLRLIREIHAELLAGGRGAEKDPGQFRRTQNWIGGTRPGNAIFIPPPSDQVQPLLGELEKFMHNEPRPTSPLIKAALAHVQFETIHPFLDGNGRIGRLLIALILYHERVLSEPLLYLSLFFKSHRQQYYDLLQAVRTRGDWEAWLAFFFTGVRETSEQAVETARQLTTIFSQDREKIKNLARAASSALRIHHELQKKPVLSIPQAVKLTRLSFPAVSAAMKNLVRLGMLRELAPQNNKRFFSYSQYLQILIEGTEPLQTESAGF